MKVMIQGVIYEGTEDEIRRIVENPPVLPASQGVDDAESKIKTYKRKFAITVVLSQHAGMDRIPSDHEMARTVHDSIRDEYPDMDAYEIDVVHKDSENGNK